MGKKKSGVVPPGANWQALKKTLPSKKPKISKNSGKSASRLPSDGFPRGPAPTRISASPEPETSKAGGSAQTPVSNEVIQLRDMVLGRGTAAERLVSEPGRYLAMDCEMVGVGEDGTESSLARASIVDFHGRVILDEFVQQRERVFDYRTKVSGIRPQDMINAKSFKEVQAKIAELLAPPDRILVGHALHNDLSALLLTHPASRTRDTQLYAAKRPPPAAKVKGKGKAVAPVSKTELTLWDKYRNPRIGLKKLTKEELGVDIQGGEHSSVTDARAAMAIYRLHKRAWDASLPISHVKPPVTAARNGPDLAGDNDHDNTALPSKRKRPSNDESFPGGGRRGVSSGLSTIIRGRTSGGSAERGKAAGKAQEGSRSHAPESKWWQTLGQGSGGGSKGHL